MFLRIDSDIIAMLAIGAVVCAVSLDGWDANFGVLSSTALVFKNGQSFQSFMEEKGNVGWLGRGRLESFGFEVALPGAAAAEFSGLCRCRPDGVHQGGAQGAFFQLVNSLNRGASRAGR